MCVCVSYCIWSVYVFVQDLYKTMSPKQLLLILNRYSLVFSFNSISTFAGYLMLKPSLEKTIEPIIGRIRGFIPFPKVLAQNWT